MAKRYYTVLARIPGQLWTPEFGDYKHEVAKEEMRDMMGYGRFPKGTKFKIITTGDQQKDITLGVEVENSMIKLEKKA